MPVYEFACSTCGEKFEKLCTMSVDDSAVECPECHSVGAERQLSSFYSMSAQSSSPAPPCGSGGGCATGQCPFS